MEPLYEKRLNSNIDCLNVLIDFLLKHPELRIEQVLDKLHKGSDYFFEEPWQTYRRWKSQL